MNALMSLWFLLLASFALAQETKNASIEPKGPIVGHQNPLLPHKFAPKRHRRQYSSEKPYEIRFLPYPSRTTRGSPGIEKPSHYIEASPTEYSNPQSPATYQTPQSTSTTTVATTTGYRPPPNGTPRDTNNAETALGNSHRYNYPPRQPLPLNSCFFNPTGYACCNAQLNDLMVETYTELEAQPNFHTCNINAIASKLQSRAEKRFNVTFETVAGFDDFAQKIHFNGDLVCKIELGGKYMLAYGTAKDAGNGPNGSANYNKYSAGPESNRHRRAAAIYGPEQQLPQNHISRSHSMWI